MPIPLASATSTKRINKHGNHPRKCEARANQRNDEWWLLLMRRPRKKPMRIAVVVQCRVLLEAAYGR
jgi:hypothetical protein